MLCELFIENLAVIEKTSIQFNKGLNVFTGETGAGKSIVIDAINAVLGQRTSKEIVRHNTKKATIIATFRDIGKKAMEKLLEYGYETENDELIISREIFADSKSTARIMGKPVTVGILKEIGTELINIHGQHDNQILLSVDKHIDILDKYGDYSNLQSEYFECYKNVVKIKREMKNISTNENEKAQKLDLLSYQVKEISEAELKIGEDIELEQKRIEFKNATNIMNNYKEAYVALFGGDMDDSGACELLKLACQSLLKASQLYEPAENLSNKLETLSAEVEEVARDISEKLYSFDFDSNLYVNIDTRLDELYKLKRKYGNTIEEILEFEKSARAELEKIELSEKRLIEISEQGKKEYERLLILAQKLSTSRRNAAKQLVSCVINELAFLDMPNVVLDIKIDATKPNSKGKDSVEFLISTNKGEPPKPIAKIASGGELSRIMLAIKNSLADKDDIETLIFDEVDTGVSGRAAQKIGLKLKQASKNRQILTVTHLAQIAALADYHYLIKKESTEKSTFTNVKQLDQDGRVYEVARIMSTDKISDLMLDTARQMIAEG